MGERPSEYARDADDWYVEPAWCVHPLISRYHASLRNGLHDPCCGGGTIPQVADEMGVLATGADLVDRADGRFPVQNFLADQQQRAAIVTNPPFRIAPQIVEHALRIVSPNGIVAAIAQAKFLFSQARHPLFMRQEMERVIVFSRRPSMPTGKMLAAEGEVCRGGGSIDFVWCVWRVGKVLPGCAMEWVL